MKAESTIRRELARCRKLSGLLDPKTRSGGEAYEVWNALRWVIYGDAPLPSKWLKHQADMDKKEAARA